MLRSTGTSTYLAFDPTGKGVTITTSAGRYQVNQLVVSAGAWVASLLPELTHLFKVQRQVQFWFDVNDSIDAYLPGKLPVFIWEFGLHHDGFVYGFPAIDGPGGGVKVATEQRDEATTVDTVNRVVSQTEVDDIYRKFVSSRLPGLTNTCLKSVACLYTSLPDSGFVIDIHPDYSDVVVVSPCSGHGFKHSAAVGEAVAELVVQGKSTLDLRAFSLTRFEGRVNGNGVRFESGTFFTV